jgi:hypothetical protein
MAGSVEGNVVDDVTGIPLAGVRVELLLGAGDDLLEHHRRAWPVLH